MAYIGREIGAISPVTYDKDLLTIALDSSTLNSSLDHGLLLGLSDDDHTQYHTNIRALSWLGTRSTTDLPEGTNFYYTSARVQSEFVGGDVTGTVSDIMITDDSHNHTSTTITLASTDLTDTDDLIYDGDFLSTGLMTRTGVNAYVGRIITGTINKIDVSNGNGSSGDPTLTISDTYTGQTSITTLGLITAGVWQGTVISDTYIASATIWNAKQNALIFGIADTNSVVIDSSSVTDNDYAKFTTSGLSGQSYLEVKSDLSLDNVENTALSTWAGSSNISNLGTITTGTWEGSTIATNNGGTGQTSYSNGQLLIGNTVGNTLVRATLTQGSGISILNGPGSITIAFDGSLVDHGTLAGLTDDDHMIYALLAGRASGQTLNGGTASGEDLILESTSNATKGNIFLNSVDGSVIVGSTSGYGDAKLSIKGSSSNISSTFVTAHGVGTTPVFSILPSASQTYIGCGVYYSSSAWVHHSNDSNNQLLVMDPGGGVYWFASNNSTGSWNVANNVLLWTDSGSWNSLVRSTATGNSYFTGGNVGIGTTTPTSKLHINNGSANGAVIQTLSGNSGNYTHWGIGRELVEATVAISSHSGLYSMDATAGDLIIRNESSSKKILMQAGAGKSVLSVNDVSVGIGTVVNRNTLDIYGNVIIGASYAGSHSAAINGLTIEGKVAIGTTSNTNGYLVVNGSGSGININMYGYMDSSGNIANYGGPSWPGATGNDYSIYANDEISASGFRVHSDQRIKTDIQSLDSSCLLNKLQRLSVKEYSYIDKPAKGYQRKIGMIAQEVESIFPTAVALATEIVPDIFMMTESIERINNISRLRIKVPHKLKKGDKVKIVGSKNSEELIVKKVLEKNVFEVENWESSDQKVFIYGKEVSDFKVLDVEQLTFVAIKAIQELKKEKDEEIDWLKKELSKCQGQNL